jgi:hypothetical protein
MPFQIDVRLKGIPCQQMRKEQDKAKDGKTNYFIGKDATLHPIL